MIPQISLKLRVFTLVPNPILNCLLKQSCLHISHTLNILHCSLCVPTSINSICFPPSTFAPQINGLHASTLALYLQSPDNPAEWASKSDHAMPLLLKSHLRFPTLLGVKVFFRVPTYFSTLISYYSLCSNHSGFPGISRTLQAYHPCIRSVSSLCSNDVLMAFPNLVCVSPPH